MNSPLRKNERAASFLQNDNHGKRCRNEEPPVNAYEENQDLLTGKQLVEYWVGRITSFLIFILKEPEI